MIIAIAIIIIIALGIAFYVIATKNKLIQLRNRVQDQWSQVDVQLKRRFDLIPNIVETVKGYASHEQDTFTKVIDARNSALGAKSATEEMEANNELTGALNKLLALSEAYPDLKANDNFKNLQNNLREVEDKIAYARQFYNDAVLKYKDAIEMFPSSIVASMFGFRPEKFFEATAEEKNNVKVQF